MALPARDQLRYWGIVIAVFLAALYLMGDVMLPFLVGGAIAYFLDPVADRLQGLGLSRVVATVFISLVALLVVVLLVLAVIPTLISQLAALIDSAPEIAHKFQAFLLQRFPELSDSTSTMRQTLTQIGEAIQSRGGELANGLLTSALSLISAVVFIVVVPVVAFYLLLDWDRVIVTVDGWIPLPYRDTVHGIARDIDRAIAGFVRGQAVICLILAAFYAIALTLIGLNFGFLIGMMTGLLGFIPFVGALTGFLIAAVIAIAQFWPSWTPIMLVVAVFAVGQVLEGYVLSPRLVGAKVGLHPVWMMFALIAFSYLFGFVGLLVAIPLAATIGVLLRFALRKYLESPIYTGQGHR